MPRSETAQINIRSTFVRDRVTALVQRTGMTATQVVEEALRAYAPPVAEPPHGRLVRKGPLLVMTGGKRVTHAETDAIIQEVRSGDPEE